MGLVEGGKKTFMTDAEIIQTMKHALKDAELDWEEIERAQRTNEYAKNYPHTEWTQKNEATKMQKLFPDKYAQYLNPKVPPRKIKPATIDAPLPKGVVW